MSIKEVEVSQATTNRIAYSRYCWQLEDGEIVVSRDHARKVITAIWVVIIILAIIDGAIVIAAFVETGHDIDELIMGIVLFSPPLLLMLIFAVQQTGLPLRFRIAKEHISVRYWLFARRLELAALAEIRVERYRTDSLGLAYGSRLVAETRSEKKYELLDFRENDQSKELLALLHQYSGRLPVCKARPVATS